MSDVYSQASLNMSSVHDSCSLHVQNKTEEKIEFISVNWFDWIRRTHDVHANGSMTASHRMIFCSTDFCVERCWLHEPKHSSLTGEKTGMFLVIWRPNKHAPVTYMHTNSVQRSHRAYRKNATLTNCSRFRSHPILTWPVVNSRRLRQNAAVRSLSLSRLTCFFVRPSVRFSFS